MYHAAQDSPDQDVSSGDYFRTGVYITEDNYTAVMMNGLAGTYGTPQKEGFIRISWVMLICRRCLLVSCVAIVARAGPISIEEKEVNSCSFRTVFLIFSNDVTDI